jgi:hypothetical protein
LHQNTQTYRTSSRVFEYIFFIHHYSKEKLPFCKYRTLLLEHKPQLNKWQYAKKLLFDSQNMVAFRSKSGAQTGVLLMFAYGVLLEL